MRPNQHPQISQINRTLARERGEKVYESGTACPRCGSFSKYVSSMSCVNCGIKNGLPKLANTELMGPYRTAENTAKRLRNWRHNNPEKLAAQVERQNERGVTTRKAAKRRARVRNQIPDHFDPEKVAMIYEEAQRLTRETGIQHEVDHVKAIAHGGLHSHENLQVLTQEANRKKGAK